MLSNMKMLSETKILIFILYVFFVAKGNLYKFYLTFNVNHLLGNYQALFCLKKKKK